ncbi:MAG TPA: proline--tRNA ligase, partial [Nitrososphaera sp.]|nr:proline--tRNA ligase [Nitrososphaera sp.]
DKTQSPRADLVKMTNELLDKVQKELYAKAKALLDGYVSSPASYSEFKSIIESKGGFARAGWCGDQKCELAIKEETGADIRVIPFEQDGMPDKCIYCGQAAKKVAMFGRAY